ncbi:MAG: DEAD/DEAH box helicase family protein [Clostridia bacterium]|nr:DEAD/DEAH box helicase family protein [Clostridia bacterium]
MCGFPGFRLEENVNALTEKGFDVVLVDSDRRFNKVISREKVLENVTEKEYDIGFGTLGNGTTVWNRLEEVDNDYKTIAHITSDGKTVKYYEDVPDAVKEQIEAFARKEEHRYNVAKEEWEKAHRHPTTQTTYGQRNYNYLKRFAPDVIDGNARYALYESEGFMPIHISTLSGAIVSIAHTYEQEGDLMYDPEMVFEIDDENKALKPLEYRQDNMGIYQTVGENITERELNSFAVQWFKNIESQGFHLSQKISEYNDEDITVSYNENGEITDIEGEENAVAEYMKKHNIEVFATAENIEQGIAENSSLPTKVQKDDILGKKIEFDGRRFIVDSVNDDFGTVSLKDITFEEGTGFPIFRRESIDFVRAILDKQEQAEQIVPEFEKIKPSKVQNTIIYPEIPMVERNNFVIDNDELGYGGAKEKFRRNMEAIHVLKKCESEHRLATPEEQKILSEYVGWGGLSDAFDETKTSWSNEFAQLRATLSSEEYAQARASTLTAHYTSPVIIKAMYNALENMGFSHGNILEPSCGIGNFMGLIPESMGDSKIYGIEIDSITGRIAQQLYQKNSVAIEGYEDTMLPDSFFDVAIGNVPFGDYKLSDKKYNKYNFLIHDYFFAKTLDKVRPGGIIAFITSSGTMDKRNSKVRRYIAQRADLVGAIRLPNNAFLKNAGTEVTSDILFFLKRDRMTDIMPDWVELSEIEKGFFINRYFADNPGMILGKMQMISGPFGLTPTCVPYDDVSLQEQLNEAIQNIHATISEYEFDDVSNDEEITIPADPNVRNFSFTIIDGDIYFRENSVMRKLQLNATAQNRVKGMIAIRDCVRELIEYQTEGYSDYEIKGQQDKLNKLYDDFTNKYGLINSRGNSLAFSDDSSYFLLCSLEVLDENGDFERKADMFSKRTIGAKQQITKVDTASEALAVSLGEKAKIDMEYIGELTGKTEDEVYEDLKGVIFLNPHYEEGNIYEPKYLTADEYLSGNVREKLSVAKSLAAGDEAFSINVEALTAVQPIDLSASEITVRLGSTWVPQEDIQRFVFDLLLPGWYSKDRILVRYSNLTGEWSITNKSADKGVKATSTFGTKRINAYKIIEESLNLKDVRIFDYIEDENGRKKPVLNKKETMIAQQKQDLIKSEFDNWIWKDPQRRERLTKLYNEKFNSNRPREYDGSHIIFNGMNPEIVLRKHQQDAVARIMYGGNSLLGHVVGAGKTWTMVAAAMEMKRLGLCNKSLFVVPNHLTEQWASEFLQLYPAANILVATKKDFETKNRKKFCGRIATGDYDAVIIGHSQFEKIPMSLERQVAILERQKEEIINGIIEAKANRAERFTVKQLEKSKRAIETKLAKLNDQSRKDDVVTFEELGVDRVFIDEAHYYKNLYLYTKMRNVGGIAQTEAQKSSDLFMKTQYLDELTGGKGVIFATGTPVSNSMVELYTMQRYLQYNTLKEYNLQYFDAWASTFGETITAIELAPEGTGYRAKTRFAKFFNLPELMSMFKDVADIQTADMLNLPTPTPHYKTIAVEPTEIQKDMVRELAERAERIRNKMVDPSVDNMLKVTNDGRKLALDQRLINPMLHDDKNSKVSACAKEVFDIWKQTTDIHGTQLVFCDLSTPKNDGTFSVYTDIRDKLLAYGVPENEIEFIHNANSETKKKELFSKVRKGDIRILLGSTPKMGAGTNVQRLLYASHDIDCPWRPADLEQRSGRIIRQGNTNPDVQIRRYVTKDTFDSYMWQLVENKQKFIGQIMTSKSPVRSAEDIDETALSYAEIKALTTGNPYIKEKMDLDTQVSKLKLIKSSFMSQKYDLEDKVIKKYPREIADLTERIKGFEGDISIVQRYPKKEDVFYPMTIDGLAYTDKEKAGNALLERCKKMTSPEPTHIGDYRGFSMELSFDTFTKVFHISLKGYLSHKVELGSDVYGNLQRIDNVLEGLNKRLEITKQNLIETEQEFEIAKGELQKEFPQETELQEKIKRLAEVDALLNMDKNDHEGAVLGEPDEAEIPQKKVVGLER